MSLALLSLVPSLAVAPAPSVSAASAELRSLLVEAAASRGDAHDIQLDPLVLGVVRVVLRAGPAKALADGVGDRVGRHARLPSCRHRREAHVLVVGRLRAGLDELVDDVVTVSNDEICAAVRDCFEDTRAMLEPAGAVAIAGLKKYVDALGAPSTAAKGNYIAISSDASNIEFDILRSGRP